MAEPVSSHVCPSCGALGPKLAPGQHCPSCGAKSGEAPRPNRSEDNRAEDAARVDRQDRFSATWCGISLAVVSILTAAIVIGLPMVVPLFDFEGSAGMLLAIPIWFVSGVLVGLISPGRTVLEPAVATFLVAMPTAFLLFTGQTVKTMPGFMYVLMSALGVLFSLIGSYVGYRIQVGPGSGASDRWTAND